MTEHGGAPDPIGAFIARWDGTEQAERANYQRFLNELCDLLGLPQPELATGSVGNYRYERGVTRREADGTTSHRRLDLYKRGCFVLEAKQAKNPKQASLFGLDTEGERRAAVRRSPSWARSMLEAKGQAERYARDVPPEEGWPPFIIVCDVGFCLDLYADFTGTGKHYAQFPDREGFRIYLPDLRRPEIQQRLRLIWTDPHALDPSRKRVQVTREIAQLLAKLARALEGPREKRRHAPQAAVDLMQERGDRSGAAKLVRDRGPPRAGPLSCDFRESGLRRRGAPSSRGASENESGKSGFAWAALMMFNT